MDGRRRQQWLTWALIAGALYGVNRLLCDAVRRREGMSRAKPPALDRWENEGGGVPVGGSHMAAQVEPQVLPR
jgi:hypothetical protein